MSDTHFLHRHTATHLTQPPDSGRPRVLQTSPGRAPSGRLHDHSRGELPGAELFGQGHLTTIAPSGQGHVLCYRLCTRTVQRCCLVPGIRLTAWPPGHSKAWAPTLHPFLNAPRAQLHWRARSTGAAPGLLRSSEPALECQIPSFLPNCNFLLRKRSRNP